MDLNRRKKVSFYTLGCKVNQYETQMLKEKFSTSGYEIVGEEEFADIYIINTCTVTNLSDRKSRQHIRRMKKINPSAVIAVTGCYAQTDPQAAADVDGVCIVAGTNEKRKLVEFIEEYIEKNGDSRDVVESHVLSYDELDIYEETGIITSMDSRNRAFIKVQEGCDRFCSYCIIPYARGKVRSRALNDVVMEAETLINKGFKELVLTGINTALYGQDFVSGNEEMSGIELLIKTISEIPGKFRIRLSSLEPNVVDAETVKRLSVYEKLCPHMHLSVQSGSDSVLKRMNRRYGAEEYKEIVNAMRLTDKNFGITTDIIVGFPGETEDEFNESMELVKNIGFLKVHVFKYSKRSGTKAADMENQIDGTVKNIRSAELIKEAAYATNSFYENNIGSIRSVLFEKVIGNNLIEGYTDNYIRVQCSCENPIELVDRFADVKLDSVDVDGMNGTIISFD